MGGDQGTRATPPRWLLRRLPEPRAPPAAPPPGSLPRTPEVSLPPVHLLHVCTRQISWMHMNEVRNARGMPMLTAVRIF